jgi:Rrf2 family protein
MAQQKGDKPVPVASHKIAEERVIPMRFLLKVLKPLVSARVLRSVKGPNGGYQLARAASEISMLEILEAVDGNTIQGQVQHDAVKGNNALNNKLEDICNQCADTLRKSLDKVHVSDLLGGKGDSKRKS